MAAQKCILVGADPVDFSPREFALLELLLLRRGRVVSKPQIQEHLCEWDDDLTDVSKKLEATPDSQSLLSKRGDLLFFRGEFAKSVRDYERMSELDPTLDRAMREVAHRCREGWGRP